MNTLNPHVLKAVAVCGGSQSELARRCGDKVRQGHVWKWLRSDLLTGEAANYLHKATDGKVNRKKVRPDLFGRAPRRTA